MSTDNENNGGKQPSNKVGTKTIVNNPVSPESALSESVDHYHKGSPSQALIITQNALMHFPQHFELLSNAGAFAQICGDTNLAEEYYRRALEIQPENPDANFNLGNILKGNNQLPDAERFYRKAIELLPQNPGAYNNLAHLLHVQNRLDEAEEMYRHVIGFQSNYPEPLFNFGNLLYEQKRLTEAENCYRSALQLNANFPEAQFRLANLLMDLKRYSDAELSYQGAIKLTPNDVKAHTNLGNLFKVQRRFEEAEQCYRQSVKLLPNDPLAYNNLGSLFHELKRYGDAEAAFRQALNLRDDYNDARSNLSFLLLQLGRFQEGWELHEARNYLDVNNRNTFAPDLNVAQWQGESIRGHRLFVWPEQGVGDEVMFASCIPDLQKYCEQVTLACDHRLQPLFSRSFPSVNVIQKDKTNRYEKLGDEFDFHCAIGSLPRFLRNTQESFQNTGSYLAADSDLLAKWKARYNRLKYRFNIGISWRGGADDGEKNIRSIPLMNWIPILEKPANFISLQYGDHSSEIRSFKESTDITIHEWDDADPLNDLDNFSAQIQYLDLVISIDNSTVHFSGALGVATLVMLPYASNWRWIEGRDDCLWYPGVMRVFRQEQNRQWDEIVSQIARTLTDI